MKLYLIPIKGAWAEQLLKGAHAKTEKNMLKITQTENVFEGNFRI